MLPCALRIDHCEYLQYEEFRNSSKVISLLNVMILSIWGTIQVKMTRKIRSKFELETTELQT